MRKIEDELAGYDSQLDEGRKHVAFEQAYGNKILAQVCTAL